MTRKIAVITARAEYEYAVLVDEGDSGRPGIAVEAHRYTGAHLSPEFGSTWKRIEDGFAIDAKVEMLLSSNDTPVAVAKSVGLGTIGFADALDRLEPDILLVLGDRFEILSAVTAATMLRIPVAHLHGGQPRSLIDEPIRHRRHKNVAHPLHRRRRIPEAGRADGGISRASLLRRRAGAGASAAPSALSWSELEKGLTSRCPLRSS